MAFVSMGENDDDAPMSDINVTPLVDVMLVLMIVFMITMPVLTHSIQINLPTTNRCGCASVGEICFGSRFYTTARFARG